MPTTSTTEEPSNSRFCLWFTSICLCATSGLPAFFGLYFPNTARPVIQSFLEQEIFKDAKNGSISDFDPETINHIWSIYASLGVIGMMIGKLLTPAFENHFGRRKSLILCSFFTSLSHLVELIAKPFHMWYSLFIGRISAFLIYGVTTTIAPVFLSEIAPPYVRGSIGVLYSMSLCIGATLSAALGLNVLLGTPELWFLAFSIPLFFSALAVPLLLVVPDPPQCIASDKSLDDNKLSRSLTFYHGNLKNKNAIIDSTKTYQKKSILSCLKLFWHIMTCAKLRQPFFLSVSVAGVYSFSGLTILNMYSATILSHAGVMNPGYFAVGLQLLSFLMFFLCLVLVDRVGRRPLLLISCFGCLLFWIIFMSSYFYPDFHWKPQFKLGLVIFTQVFINLGIRPLIYTLVPEIFPSELKGAALALTGVICGIMQAPIMYAMPPLLPMAGSLSYVLLVVPLAGFSLHLLFKLPETKGFAYQK